jgi:phage-related protein
VHRSNKELVRFLKDFVSEHNKTCGPFVWTKGPEKLRRIIQLTKSYQIQTHSH